MNNVIFRSKGVPLEIDAAVVVRAFTCDGISTTTLDLTGALTSSSSGTFTGLKTTTFTSTGFHTATGGVGYRGTTTIAGFTMPAGMSFFYGSKDNQAVVLPSAAAMPGAIIYVTTAGTGTITLTGSASETWGGAGTGTITPGKYWLGWSNSTNWNTVIASL